MRDIPYGFSGRSRLSAAAHHVDGAYEQLLLALHELQRAKSAETAHSGEVAADLERAVDRATRELAALADTLRVTAATGVSAADTEATEPWADHQEGD